jgi:hypothetical protein
LRARYDVHLRCRWVAIATTIENDLDATAKLPAGAVCEMVRAPGLRSATRAPSTSEV